MKKRTFLFFLIIVATNVFSQTIDKKAKCVSDFTLSKDTLTFFCRTSSCDSMYYYKFQVFNTSAGLTAKQFHIVKLKQGKRCYDLEKPDPRAFKFTELCTSNVGPVTDLKTLSEFELSIRNPKVTAYRCDEKVGFYIYSKNQKLISKKKVHCIAMLDKLFNILTCITLDRETKSGK